MTMNKVILPASGSFITKIKVDNLLLLVSVFYQECLDV